MFSKNIKVLSLFLVLAVVMIGALGAVSAADADTANVTTDNNGVITDGSTTITGTVATNTSNNGVDSGSPVNDTISSGAVNGTAPTYTTDGKLYNAKGEEVTGTTYTATTATALNATGGFTVDLKPITGTYANGTTYYFKLSVLAGVAGTATDTAGTGTTAIAAATYLVPYTFNGAQINTTNTNVTTSYGDNSWNFNGVLYDATGNPITSGNITFSINTTTATNGTLTINKAGQFKFNPYDTTPTAGTTNLENLPAGKYNITLTYTGTNGVTTTNVYLNINKVKLVIDATTNQTTYYFGEKLNATAFVNYLNGTLFNSTTQNIALTYTFIGDNGVQKTTDITFGDFKDGKTVESALTDIANIVKSGTYYVTVNGTATSNTNYEITGDTLSFTIIPTETVVITEDKTINVTNDTTFTENVGTNTTTGIVNNTTGSFTWVIYDSNNKVVKTGTETAATNAKTILTVNDGLANGNYTLKVTFTPTDAGYTSSVTSIPIVVKNSITLSDNVTNKISFDFGTIGNATTIKLTLNPALNTTVTVYKGNTSLGTIKLINGTANYTFSDLTLAAGEYTFTFAYAGDDTYQAVKDTVTVTVNPLPMNTTINANPGQLVNVTINSINKTITLNLTNSSNASQIIDYTGDVYYTVTNAAGKVVANGTVAMTNGKATFEANTLKGLTDGKNTVTFWINNNYTSKSDKVIVNTVQLTSDIIANNVTTNNATPITITGTIVNATEGTVKVDLKDAKNNTIATVYGNVAADGTFTVAFGNYANGVYTANITYNSTTGLSSNNTKNVTVTVNGTAPTPVVGNVTTNLTINTNFTEAYGEGLNLTGKLTDANGNPIVGQHIALNLTNPTTGASKIYWVTTDTNGEYQLQINLFVGSYTASASFAGFTTADNKTYYLPSGPANGTITVTNGTEPVDNRTATVLAFSNFTEKYGQALNFTGTLKTTNGTAIVGQKVAIELFNKAGQSKVYWRTTDTDGAVQLPIELFAGDYTFKCTFAGDSTYQPSNNQEGSITVTA